MVAISRIPARYTRLIPAAYFALLGIFDIGMDLWHHTLRWEQLGFNLLLMVPLLIRRKPIWTIFGWVGTIFWAYLFIVVFVWFTDYLIGKPFRYPAETFGIGLPFTAISLTCSIALIYLGRDKHR